MSNFPVRRKERLNKIVSGVATATAIDWGRRQEKHEDLDGRYFNDSRTRYKRIQFDPGVWGPSTVNTDEKHALSTPHMTTFETAKVP